MIKAGCIVQLKSGGITMTVGSLTDDQKVARCFWSVPQLTSIQYKDIPVAALEVVVVKDQR